MWIQREYIPSTVKGWCCEALAFDSIISIWRRWLPLSGQQRVLDQSTDAAAAGPRARRAPRQGRGLLGDTLSRMKITSPKEESLARFLQALSRSKGASSRLCCPPSVTMRTSLRKIFSVCLAMKWGADKSPPHAYRAPVDRDHSESREHA